VVSSVAGYTYGYDGQITQKNISGSGCVSSSLNIQYDDAGRIVNVGAGVQGGSGFYSNYKYTYDRITQIQTNGKQAVSTSGYENASYEYYPDGKLKKITYPVLNDGSSLTTEYVYNALGRLTSMANKKGSTVLSQYTYTYDANGNITSVYDGKTTRSYVYDKLNRLIEIVPQNGNSTVYSYDLMGNRLTESSDRSSINHVSTSYTYKLDNKLESVTKGSTTVTMSYNADGMRAKETTASGTSYYIYNLSGRLVAEGQSTSVVNANYVWGPDRVLVRKEAGGGEYYYLYNGHGDVIQIVDRNGNIVNNYSYDEWGNITASSETVSNPFKYAGAIYDQETGLYYLNARYYDPSIGRFINEDPVEGQVDNPLSLNLYTYCINNPLIYVDPTGNKPIDITRTLARWLIGNPVNNYVTRHPGELTKELFYVAGFWQDHHGVWHARQDALQQYGGYNFVYDIIFDYATSMKKAITPFTHDGQDFRFWAWKGDYLNLGAGCELGIYYRLVVNGYETDHWLAYTSSKLTMTLMLTDKDGHIAFYKPSDPQWWITAFNPFHYDVQADGLTATFYINFENDKDMYEDFIESDAYKNDPGWSISPRDKYTLIFTFKGGKN
jgi:RHS repeat-associated protein